MSRSTADLSDAATLRIRIIPLRSSLPAHILNEDDKLRTTGSISLAKKFIWNTQRYQTSQINHFVRWSCQSGQSDLSHFETFQSDGCVKGTLWQLISVRLSDVTGQHSGDEALEEEEEDVEEGAELLVPRRFDRHLYCSVKQLLDVDQQLQLK